MDQQEFSFIDGENENAILKKLNIVLLYISEIVLLEIYLNELQTYIHTNICTWIAALFIIAPN